MTDNEIIALATTDAAEAIEYARGSGPEAVVFITGNSYMPTYRDFGSAETVWQLGDEGDGWELYAETFESLLHSANVMLTCPDYDNALYVVDLSRFAYRDADYAEYLSDEWIEVNAQ